MERYYTTNEVARMLGLRYNTIQTHVSKKHLLPLQNVKSKRHFFARDKVKEFVENYYPNKLHEIFLF